MSFLTYIAGPDPVRRTQASHPADLCKAGSSLPPSGPGQ